MWIRRGDKSIESGKLKPGRKLLIIRAAIGGTGFSDERWGMTDDLYLRMIEMIKTALELNSKNKLAAFLWHQGETDAILNVKKIGMIIVIVFLLNKNSRLSGAL